MVLYQIIYHLQIDTDFSYLFFPPSFLSPLSGAHLNPAVSLSCCVLGRLPWSKLLPYCMSQVLGAYIAAVVVFLVYYGGSDKTCGRKHC